VIKAVHVASAADIHAAEAFRTDFHLFDRRGKGLWGGNRRELRLGAAARPALRSAGDRRRRPAPGERRRGDRVAHPYAVDVASGVEAEPAARTTPR
jgi:phosphoribosylanthranilate isomerase